MANGRFLLWIKNVLKINTVPGYTADYDKTRGDSVFIDNYNRVMEVNNLQEGLAQTQYHGLKASILDGSSQYWQLALPAEQITNSTFETNVLNWIAEGTLTQDAELGKQGNYCAKWVYATNQTLTPALTIATTVGQKYKVKLYYKSNANISFQSGTTTVRTLVATSEWNYVSFIFTAVSTSVRLLGTASGIGFFDNVSMVLDQGLDANQDQEQILHSKNADFERTLGAELSTNSGATGLTDWVDSNADGIANDWANSGFATSENEFTEMLATGGFSTFNKSGNDITLAICDAPSNYARTGQVTDMVLAAGTYRITFTLTVNSGSGTFRWRLSTSSSLSSAVAGGEQTYSTTGTHTYDVVISTPGTYFWGLTSTGTGLLNFALTNVSIALIAEVNSIVTNGWTGNAQKVANVSGGLSSLKHSAGTYAAGTKCIISGEYKSSHEFGIYKNATDYYGTLLPASSSPKPFQFEVLLTDAVWFFGTKNAAPTWLEVDKVSVKPIPNLVTNGTFTTDTDWSKGLGWSISGGKAVGTSVNGSPMPSQFGNKLISGKRYRYYFELSNVTAGSVAIWGGLGSGYFNTNGVKSGDFTHNGTNGDSIYFYGNSGFTGEIDNFHIYEIPEWSPSFAPVSGNNHYCDISILDKAAGTQSQKITASGAGRGVELSVNSGASGLTDWTNPSSGIAQSWSAASSTCSIVTGNGFTGNAQRAQMNGASAGYIYLTAGILTNGKTYEITGKYRSNIQLNLNNWSAGQYGVLSANTGNAQFFRVNFTHNNGDQRFYFGITVPHVAGDWFEIDEISVKEVLGEISLPSANLESCVSGKKYTLEGKARLDPASLTYGSNILTSDGTADWNVGNGTGGVVGGEYVLVSTGTGYIFRAINSPNNILKVTFKAKADSYTGKIDVYHQSNSSIYAASTTNLTSTYQTFVLYITARSNQQTFYIQLQSTHTGNVYFDDLTIQGATPIAVSAQIGSKSITSNALSIIAGTFTRFVLNFEATTAEVNADLRLYLSGAGAVFTDRITLNQAFDFAVLQNVKHTFGSFVGYSLSMYNPGGGGLAIAKAADDKLYTYTYDNANTAVVSTGQTFEERYSKLVVVSTNTEHKVLINGVLKDTKSTLTLGKKTAAGLMIGWALAGGGTRLKGQVAQTVIIRFENMSKTDFDPSTYEPGATITDLSGGVPEVVLWQDWTNIVGAIAMDKYRPETTRRNDLTAYGSPLASTNIVAVKDFSPQTKKLRQGSMSLQPTFNSVSGFVFNGTNNILIASQNFGDVKTIILKIKVDTLESEQDLLQLNDSTVLTLNTDGSITATGFFEETIKIQTTLLADALVTTDQEYLVCVKSGGGISTDSFKLGGSSTYLKGNIKKVTLFSTELDDATIQKIFKSIRSI